MYLYLRICVCAYVCKNISVGVRVYECVLTERWRERERDGENERERKKSVWFGPVGVP